MSGKKWSAAVVSREEQQEQKRMAVLQAGVKLFNTRGYEKTTLDDIASALNITKRTIYYYVKSKDEILFECMRLGLVFAEEALAKSADATMQPIKRIEVLVSEYLKWIFTDFGACLALLTDESLSEERRKALRQSKATLDFHLRTLISEGLMDGSIRKCDPKLTAAAIFGAMNWVPHWNRNARSVPEPQIIAQYTKFFVAGLRQPNTTNIGA